MEYMVNEVMENLDTFVLEPAPQVRRGGAHGQQDHGEPRYICPRTSASGRQNLEHMVKKVIKNLDTFVLEQAPEVGRSWSTL